MTYRFIKQRDPANKFDVSVIEHSVDAVSIPDLLEAFEAFLKGCGFVFDGHIDIVEEEE